VVSQHEELISSKFDTAGNNSLRVCAGDTGFLAYIFSIQEYKPSMEILAVGLKYNNETAMLSVSVYVGVPEISSSDISNNSTMSELESTSASTHSPSSETVEKFTNYEIYLSALSIDDSSEPPSSCLNFLFLQHSSQNVVVGCNETEKVLPKYIDESPTTCVDVDTVLTKSTNLKMFVFINSVFFRNFLEEFYGCV
jgi:hypothetical protein